MGDWADDLAADIVRGIEQGFTDADIIAVRLRTLKAEAQTEIVTNISRMIDETLLKPGTGLGGGDK